MWIETQLSKLLMKLYSKILDGWFTKCFTGCKSCNPTKDDHSIDNKVMRNPSQEWTHKCQSRWANITIQKVCSGLFLANHAPTPSPYFLTEHIRLSKIFQVTFKYYVKL